MSQRGTPGSRGVLLSHTAPNSTRALGVACGWPRAPRIYDRVWRPHAAATPRPLPGSLDLRVDERGVGIASDDDGRRLARRKPEHLRAVRRHVHERSVGAAVDLPQIDGADIVREATRWGITASTSTARVVETTERLIAALPSVEPLDLPMSTRTLDLVRLNAERVIGGVRSL